MNSASNLDRSETPKTDKIALRLTGHKGLFCDNASLAQYNDLLRLCKKMERRVRKLEAAQYGDYRQDQ